MWTEPFAGNESEYDIEDEVSYLSDTKFGGKAFSKVRRFVVVGEKKGACLCIPLNTYRGEGATKRGINPRDHAAVYPEGGKPKLRSGERDKIVKDPFPIIVEDPNEKIDPMSRLNFGRVYTVEHNVKVQKVGRIPDSHHKLLRRYFLESIAGPQEDSEHEMARMASNLPAGATNYEYGGSSSGQVPSQLRQQQNSYAATMQPHASYQSQSTPYANPQSYSQSAVPYTEEYTEDHPEDDSLDYAY